MNPILDMSYNGYYDDSNKESSYNDKATAMNHSCTPRARASPRFRKTML